MLPPTNILSCSSLLAFTLYTTPIPSLFYSALSLKQSSFFLHFIYTPFFLCLPTIPPSKFSSPALSPAKEPQKVPLFPSYVAYTEEGTVRVDVRKSPQLIGIKSSRGVRPVNQDRAMFRPVRIPGMVADRRDKGSAQAMFFGIFDGYPLLPFYFTTPISFLNYPPSLSLSSLFPPFLPRIFLL
ncbi:hypothetical protein AYI69_g9801 [Smittium culicis]|uniref:Uncharacterized protein n=1 Tax=Smittium culicis TaxID=133412 RepID=A0A1R1XA59_9FUNG|nr:hypothetical protein AYI69_g9801 [Smittium culicis]